MTSKAKEQGLPVKATVTFIFSPRALGTLGKKIPLQGFFRMVPHRTLWFWEFWDSQVRRASTVSHRRLLHSLVALTVGKVFLIFSFNFLLISSHNSSYMVLMAQQCNPGSQSWSVLLQFYCVFIINNLQNSLRTYSGCLPEKKRHFNALGLLPEAR